MPDLEVAPMACIVCGKKAPEGQKENVPGWAYLAGAEPIGSITCGSDCMKVAIERHEKGLRVDGKPRVQERPCPWCGRLVVTNDDDRSIAHEAPECPEFSDLMSRAGPNTTTVVQLDTEGRPIKPGKA